MRTYGFIFFMTIYMSCFSCSKVVKMVEDPLNHVLNRGLDIVQDLSGVVHDISGVVLELKTAETAVQERVETITDVAKTAVQERVDTIADVAETIADFEKTKME